MIHCFQLLFAISTCASTPRSSGWQYLPLVDILLVTMFVVLVLISEIFFLRYCGTSTGVACGLAIATAFAFSANEYRITADIIRRGSALQISIATSYVAI